MSRRAESATATRHGAWYRQPVVWLGTLVFAASIAGCIWIIVVGVRHADVPVDTAHGSVFGVPSASLPDAQRPASPQP